MIISLFFKKIKNINQPYKIKTVNTLALTKLPLFLPTLHYLRGLKIFRKMYYHHVMLNKIKKVHLYYVTLPFKFFYWAPFKSFKPAFSTIYKKKSQKTRKKRPKFILRTSASSSISPRFVKKWMNKYLLNITQLYIWQKILFIYISLIQARRHMPIFYWYTNAAARMLPPKYRRK